MLRHRLELWKDSLSIYCALYLVHLEKLLARRAVQVEHLHRGYFESLAQDQIDDLSRPPFEHHVRLDDCARAVIKDSCRSQVRLLAKEEIQLPGGRAGCAIEG